MVGEGRKEALQEPTDDILIEMEGEEGGGITVKTRRWRKII